MPPSFTHLQYWEVLEPDPSIHLIDRKLRNETKNNEKLLLVMRLRQK